MTIEVTVDEIVKKLGIVGELQSSYFKKLNDKSLPRTLIIVVEKKVEANEKHKK